MTDPRDYQQIAAKALAKCAANDPWFPQPNRATVLAWAEQIAIYRLDEADVLAGVTVAYRDHGSGFRPLPRDIVQAAVAIRRDRPEPAPWQLAPKPEPPAHVDGPDGQPRCRRHAFLKAAPTDCDQCGAVANDEAAS